jgi:exopolysaccharide biosynthesis predicted pyruvyltransferase EpsI
MDEFAEFLLDNRKKRFLVVDPLGSKCDKLIFMGMKKKLDEFGINYHVSEYRTESFLHERLSDFGRRLSQQRLRAFGRNLKHVVDAFGTMTDRKASTIESSSDDIFLLRGGAYLNDIWKEYNIVYETLAAATNKPDTPIVVAPQSYIFTTTDFAAFFKNIRNEVHLFCRERYSFALLESMEFSENVHIHLSPDTALYLSKRDFGLDKALGNEYVLISPRDDKEGAVNWEIGDIPPHKRILLGDAIHVRGFRTFVELIGNASEVYTDRLHVAIFSSILGKKTHLYPNSYYKNKGIYEFSLHTCPNVEFVDSYKFLGLK